MKIKNFPRFIGMPLFAITIFAACSKDANKNSPTTSAAVKMDAVILKTDTGIYVPIGKDGLEIVNQNLQSNAGKPKRTYGDSLNRTKVSSLVSASLINGLYADYTSKNGNTYGIIGHAYWSDAQLNLYLLKDGVKIAYLGTTTPAPYPSTAGHTIIISEVFNCNSVYALQAEDFTGGNNFAFQTNNLKPFDYKTSPGMGAEGSGADVKIVDINRNGIPDIVLMANDNPAGANTYRYKVLFDVNPDGTSSNVSATKIIAADVNEAEGSGMAFGDIDGNGIIDMVLMSYDAPSGPNNFRYKIGYNINANGDAAYWSNSITIPGVSDMGSDAKIALADIDKNGILDIVLMAADKPTNNVISFRSKIGFNINSNGQTVNWTAPYYWIDYTTTQAQGAGMDVISIDNSGQLFFAFMLLDHNGVNKAKCYTYAINNLGTPLDQGANGTEFALSLPSVMTFGTQSQGAGIAFGDINRNGGKDIIIMSYDNPAGMNSFRYYLAYDLAWTPLGLYQYGYFNETNGYTCN